MFDFSGVLPPSNRVTAFQESGRAIACSKVLTLSAQVTQTGGEHAVRCFRVPGGNRNRSSSSRCTTAWASAFISLGQSNLVLNCDAWNNRGLDSFPSAISMARRASVERTLSSGNVFRGCRAWFNNDDGFDCINAKAAVTFDNCWAFYNGYFTNFGSGATGMASSPAATAFLAVPIRHPVPRHVTKFCLAVRNKANGFYANHHRRARLVQQHPHSNSVNFNMLCNLDAKTNLNDVPGFDHLMKNNLGFKARSTEVSTSARQTMSRSTISRCL